MKGKKWIILLAVVGLLAALAVWQWSNIQAVYLYLTMDRENIAQQMEDTRQNHQQTLEQDHAITVKPPSLEQSNDLLDGKVSAEEVKESLGIVQPAPTPQPKKKTAEELKNECVAELYALKVDVMAKLGAMKQELLDTWVALPAEQRTQKKKLDLGYAALEDCYDYEVEVNKQVRAVLEKYRPLLKEIGADTGILETLWKQYCEEKASEKAYYLDKYL